MHTHWIDDFIEGYGRTGSILNKDFDKAFSNVLIERSNSREMSDGMKIDVEVDSKHCIMVMWLSKNRVAEVDPGQVEGLLDWICQTKSHYGFIINKHDVNTDDTLDNNTRQVGLLLLKGLTEKTNVTTILPVEEVEEIINRAYGIFD